MVTNTRSGRIPSNERCRSLRSAAPAKRSSTKCKSANVKFKGTSRKPSHFVDMDNSANKTAKLKKQKKRLNARAYRASMLSGNTNSKKVSQPIKEGGEEHQSNDFEKMTIHCTDKSSLQLPLIGIASETDGASKKASPLTQKRKRCLEKSIPSTDLTNKNTNANKDRQPIKEGREEHPSNDFEDMTVHCTDKNSLQLPLVGVTSETNGAFKKDPPLTQKRKKCLKQPIPSTDLTNKNTNAKKVRQPKKEGGEDHPCTDFEEMSVHCTDKSSLQLPLVGITSETDGAYKKVSPLTEKRKICLEQSIPSTNLSNKNTNANEVRQPIKEGREVHPSNDFEEMAVHCTDESSLHLPLVGVTSETDGAYKKAPPRTEKRKKCFEQSIPSSDLTNKNTNANKFRQPKKEGREEHPSNDFEERTVHCTDKSSLQLPLVGIASETDGAYKKASPLTKKRKICSVQSIPSTDIPNKVDNGMVTKADEGKELYSHAAVTECNLSSSCSEALQVKSSPFKKLAKLPDGLPHGFNDDHLNCINRIFEFWHKLQNAILMDDQNRIIKSILFILALRSYASRPFIVISTITFLQLWKTEFMRLAPSINVILYSGNKDARKIIQNVEFYTEGGSVMFQVLLSHPDAIAEDIGALELIGWESIIVDDCQNPRISKCFELFNQLSASFKLLLMNAPLKDSVLEYVNLLSFLDTGEKERCSESSDILKSYSNSNAGSLEILKEKLLPYVAYERKSDSSKFVEYWVPVCLSNVQLEQYCSILLSNPFALRSCPRIDLVGAAHDILISARKCCDHPFLVDYSLQSVLIKGLADTEHLDVGVNASGKLHLLDMILHELKKKKLRVLILFQSAGGTSRNRMGDFLDDFLCQRFGTEFYERIDNGLSSSKKSSALKKFNSKSLERFVLLIENRACLPSINLSSIDAVIIYDSDLYPLNDLKSLQKISIESQSDQIKVFRFYTPFTIEEKALILAKEDQILENSMQTVNSTMSHLLLSWGASYLFNKLDEFHQKNNLMPGSEASAVDLLINNVAEEVLKELQVIDVGTNTSKCSILVKALQSRMSYSRNILLLGEKEGIIPMDIDPSCFWSNLLDGRSPRWRLIPGLSKRSRRKISNGESDVQKQEVDQARKKYKSLAKNLTDPINVSSGFRDKGKEFKGDTDGMRPEKLLLCTGTWNDTKNSQPMPNENSGSLMSPHIEQKEKEELRNAQEKIFSSLEPDLLKLCDVFNLSEDVKNMALKFLKYIINTHRVDQQPEIILQAFKISLCWQAASFLKHNVDHKETLAVARSCLGFECSIDEVGPVFSKLHDIMEKFSHETNALKSCNEPNVLTKSLGMTSGEDVADCMDGTTSKPQASNLSQSDESEPNIAQHMGKLGSEQTEPIIESCAKVQKVSSLTGQKDSSLTGMDLESQINMINERFQDRISILIQKQKDEVVEFIEKKEEEKAKLLKSHKEAMVLIKSLHLDSAAASNRFKKSDNVFFKKLAGFEERMKVQRQRLKLMQIDARNKEREIKCKWINEAKAGTLTESFHDLPLTNSGFWLEDEKGTNLDCFKEVLLLSNAPDHQNIDSVPRGPFSEAPLEPSSEMPVAVPNVENDKTGDANYFSSELNNVDALFHVNASSKLAMTISKDEAVNTTVETAEMPLQIVDKVLHIEPDNTNKTVTSPAVAKDISIETESQASQQQVNMLQNVVPSNAHIASGILEAGLSDDNEIENATQTSQIHNSTAVGEMPDAIVYEHLAVHGNSDNASWVSSPLQNQLELPSSSRISASLFENFALYPKVPPTISLQPSLVPEVSLSDLPTDAAPGIRSNPPAADSILINDRIIPVATATEQQQRTQILGPIQQSDSSGRPPTVFLGDITRTAPSESRSFLPQILSMVTRIPPVYHPDPFDNEFIKLGKLEEICTKFHEDKKQKLMLQLEQDMDIIKKKFKALFQTAETEFVHEREQIRIIYKKVLMNHKLAEEFSKTFIEPRKERPVTSRGMPPMQQQHSQSQPSHRPAECKPQPAPLLNTVSPMQQHSQLQPSHRPAECNPRPASLPNTVVSPSTTPSPALTQSVRPRPSVSALPSCPIRPWVPNQMGIQRVTEPRAPAPHLNRARTATLRQDPSKSST